MLVLWTSAKKGSQVYVMRTMLGSTDSSYLDPNFESDPGRNYRAGVLPPVGWSRRFFLGESTMARMCWCVLAAGMCAASVGCDGDADSPPTLSLTKYDSPVRALAIDPTGMTLATAGQRAPNAGVPSLLFWDLKTGKSKGGYAVGKVVEDVHYSKDGKRISSTCRDDGTLTVWDTDTAKPVFRLDGKESQWVNRAALAPDGKTVATSDVNDKIRLWDIDTGKERGVLEGHTANVNSLAFSPDGKLLASASSDKTVRVWDVAARKSLATFTDHTGTR